MSKLKQLANIIKRDFKELEDYTGKGAFTPFFYIKELELLGREVLICTIVSEDAEAIYEISQLIGVFWIDAQRCRFILNELDSERDVDALSTKIGQIIYDRYV